ncbi:MAG: type 1 glutamine amidotransferase [Rhizobiaceae bacterium]
MKIGILETGRLPEELARKHGDYPAMFARLLDGQGFKFRSWPVLDGKFPDSVHACDGWLITGSRHGAYEGHDWIPPLEEFIRKVYKAGIPLVGICFGHQIMAQALGGKVVKFDGGWGLGRNRYVNKDGKEFELHALHQDQVVECPPDAVVTASSPFCENAAFAYRGNAISYQPHPEFTAQFMHDLIEVRKGQVLPVDLADAALKDLGSELDSGKIAVEIAEFFKRSVRKAA